MKVNYRPKMLMNQLRSILVFRRQKFMPAFCLRNFVVSSKGLKQNEDDFNIGELNRDFRRTADNENKSRPPRPFNQTKFDLEPKTTWKQHVDVNSLVYRLIDIVFQSRHSQFVSHKFDRWLMHLKANVFNLNGKDTIEIIFLLGKLNRATNGRLREKFYRQDLGSLESKLLSKDFAIASHTNLLRLFDGYANLLHPDESPKKELISKIIDRLFRHHSNSFETAQVNSEILCSMPPANVTLRKNDLINILQYFETFFKDNYTPRDLGSSFTETRLLSMTVILNNFAKSFLAYGIDVDKHYEENFWSSWFEAAKLTMSLDLKRNFDFNDRCKLEPHCYKFSNEIIDLCSNAAKIASRFDKFRLLFDWSQDVWFRILHEHIPTSSSKFVKHFYDECRQVDLRRMVDLALRDTPEQGKLISRETARIIRKRLNVGEMWNDSDRAKDNANKKADSGWVSESQRNFRSREDVRDEISADEREDKSWINQKSYALRPGFISSFRDRRDADFRDDVYTHGRKDKTSNYSRSDAPRPLPSSSKKWNIPPTLDDAADSEASADFSSKFDISQDRIGNHRSEAINESNLSRKPLPGSLPFNNFIPSTKKENRFETIKRPSFDAMNFSNRRHTFEDEKRPISENFETLIASRHVEIDKDFSSNKKTIESDDSAKQWFEEFEKDFGEKFANVETKNVIQNEISSEENEENMEENIVEDELRAKQNERNLDKRRESKRIDDNEENLKEKNFAS